MTFNTNFDIRRSDQMTWTRHYTIVPLLILHFTYFRALDWYKSNTQVLRRPLFHSCINLDILSRRTRATKKLILCLFSLPSIFDREKFLGIDWMQKLGIRRIMKYSARLVTVDNSFDGNVLPLRSLEMFWKIKTTGSLLVQVWDALNQDWKKSNFSVK